MIGDLGHAKNIDVNREWSNSNINIGTPCYNAPETYMGEVYSKKIDIWYLQD